MRISHCSLGYIINPREQSGIYQFSQGHLCLPVGPVRQTMSELINLSLAHLEQTLSL